MPSVTLTADRSSSAALVTRGPGRRGRGGFTFMEILFAVMILGIGFIMVAAMFPAALRQTQANVEENEFNATARAAAETFDNLAYSLDPRWASYVKNNPTVTGSAARWLDLLTGWVINDTSGTTPLDYDRTATIANNRWGRPVPWSFHDTRFSTQGPWNALASIPPLGQTTGNDPSVQPYTALWDLVRGNMINPERRAQGWVALWSRPRRVVNSKEVAGPSIQLFIFPVHSRSKVEYDPNATIVGSNPAAPNPACDITYDQANFDPTLITIGYIPPPANNANPNAPNGVLQLLEYCSGPGGSQPVAFTSVPRSAYPVTDGSYVVVSNDTNKIIAPFPDKYNGMIFKLGSEVADTQGASGTSNGQYWAVDEIINLPSEAPFGIVSPSKIEVTAFPTNAMSGQGVHALVIGRQPDPSDPLQQSDSLRKQQPQANTYPNRTGITQELGYYPWSVVVQQ